MYDLLKILTIVLNIFILFNKNSPVVIESCEFCDVFDVVDDWFLCIKCGWCGEFLWVDGCCFIFS